MFKKSALSILLGLSVHAHAADYGTQHDNNISGFALLGGVNQFNGDLGDMIDFLGGDQSLLTISGSYTWSNGFGIGLTSTTMGELGNNDNLNHGYADFYAAYTLDSNVKFMAGMGAIVLLDNFNNTHTNEALMLGVGYTFDSGFALEYHHSFNEEAGLNANVSTILIGYKW
ncbi:hypothetical protein JCM19237_4408 [Photobacterium aphoticum]|uniref:Outer membrane protein beta-barrel domain-containing protein n=1 Tax=Photobacterium aphoticum TaxID=754436 RepID=A0A090RBV9_9GAMM|nr:hypothetical protein JCM19237_4408 [Photobacterium aphoticum]